MAARTKTDAKFPSGTYVRAAELYNQIMRKKKGRKFKAINNNAMRQKYLVAPDETVTQCVEDAAKEIQKEKESILNAKERLKKEFPLQASESTN